jgi:hypothetical protein
MCECEKREAEKRDRRQNQCVIEGKRNKKGANKERER